MEKKIKVGDVVIEQFHRYGLETSRLLKIERITKTQIILENTVKLKMDFTEVGVRYNNKSFRLGTPERLQEREKAIKAYSLQKYIKEQTELLNKVSLPLEQLEKWSEFLKGLTTLNK